MSAKFANLMTSSEPKGSMGGVRPPPAPGLRGKGSKTMGMAPRQSFAPMNTAVPGSPLAGAMDQKALEPPNPMLQAPPAPPPMMKMNSARGSEVSMATTMAARPPRLQDMLKTAMAESSRRVNVALEAARHMNDSLSTPEAIKTASAEGTVDPEYALKLASAIEYIAADFNKEGSDHESKVGPGKGPSALEVTQMNRSDPFPAHSGEGHNTIPMHTPLQSAGLRDPKSQLQNDADHFPGGKGVQTTAMTAGKGKAASVIREAVKKKEAEASKSSLAAGARALQTKVAEDALNPAKITAGKAVPPDSSASGESGGAPVGGLPHGPRHLIHSTEAAINYKRNAAYGGRKEELKQYFNEPALTMSTDKTLAAAFDHTGEAGTKYASAGGGSTKVAAAKAVLLKLAEEAEQRAAKDKGEKEKGAASGASH